MIDRRITFCIPSKNNLRYLKSSIQSIKENSLHKNEIIVYVDADNDGTKEWLDANNIKYLVNETDIPKGIAYGYNRCIEAATTPIVCMFHADMYMGQWFDDEILKHLKPLSVVSGTRIEPPLHPQGLEKIVEDFGMYPEDFKKQEFDKFVYEMRYTFQDKTTKGIFAPWAIYKEDITSIGMHDESFHSYHEDSDMFNRFILNGYEIVQTWAALVYHLTCRGGQFAHAEKMEDFQKREVSDGFVIAERDLSLRGPGELLGARQSGDAMLRFVDLQRDAWLIELAQQAAERLLAEYPDLVEKQLARWLGSRAEFLKA